MFKLVAGGNGRTVYIGDATNISEKGLSICGDEWNKTTREMEEKRIKLRIDYELQDTYNSLFPELKEGDKVLTTVMPARKEDGAGTAEEMAVTNQAIIIKNENNTEKYIIRGIIKNKRWNQKHTLLYVSFSNITDTENNLLGTKSEYTDRNGMVYENYWLNVNIFNNPQTACFYNAEKADAEMNKGDEVVIVTSKKKNEYNGKIYTNFNCDKFFLLKREK